MTKKIRAPFKIHGGKHYLANFIISHFPEDYEKMSYLELFGGAASVLLNKKPSIREVYNDLHPPTANVFYCLVNYSKTLIDDIRKIEYKEESFRQALEFNFCYGTVASALNEIILRRMSRGGMKKHFSWSERLRGGRPGDLNAWETFKDLLPLISERLKNVEVHNINALDLLEKHMDDEDILYYLDPPYVKSSRTAKDVYDCEMIDEDHRKLASVANRVKGKVIISGYDSPLYRELYDGWRWVSKEMPNNSGQSKVKQRRLEWIILNY